MAIGGTQVPPTLSSTILLEKPGPASGLTQQLVISRPKFPGFFFIKPQILKEDKGRIKMHQKVLGQFEWSRQDFTGVSMTQFCFELVLFLF